MPREPSISTAMDEHTLFVEELFAHYRDPLIRYLAGLMSHYADAEDVAQEAYARLLAAKDLDRHGSRARSYLFRVATNLAYDRFRKRRVRCVDESADQSPNAPLALERNAADWYVALDAEPPDGVTESDFATWLEIEPGAEAAFERCEAAVHMLRELASDPDMRWVFEDAASQGAGAATPRHGNRNPWHRNPRLAWVVAGAAAIAACAALLRDVSPRPVEPAAVVAAATTTPLTLIFDTAVVEPVATLPGNIVVDARSIAVLPFAIAVDADSGGSAQLDANVAAELHEGIVDQLASIPGVYVVDRRLVSPYSNLDLAPEAIAAQLGVRGVVEGQLVQNDGRIRVVLRVTDATTESLVVEDSFERPADELPEISTDIVTNIAFALANPAGGSLNGIN